MEFSSEFLKSITNFEGSTNWMYLDTAGNVTAGVGHLIPSPERAAAIPFLGNDPFHDWCRVKRAYRGKVADYYKRCSTCRLTPRGIEVLLQADLAAAALQLTAGLPCFSTLPLNAQQALCDMAFNLGAARLLESYPKLLECVAAGNWEGAAAQCLREGIAPERNAWCAGMFRAS